MAESKPLGRLIFVCGLPGAGKTTLAKSLKNRLHAIRFSADEWMEALSLLSVIRKRSFLFLSPA
jgi:predicted kinase